MLSDRGLCREKSLHIHFMRSPVEVLGSSEGRATGVKLERTRLEAGDKPGGDQRARGTGWARLQLPLPARHSLSLGWLGAWAEGS